LLLNAGFEAITVLYLSEKALATSKARLGARSTNVKWVAAEVTVWQPSEIYDVRHDRATFHFLTKTLRPFVSIVCAVLITARLPLAAYLAAFEGFRHAHRLGSGTLSIPASHRRAAHG